MRLPENVLYYILNNYEPMQRSTKEKKHANLKYSSEYKRNRKIFRGHSNYKKQGKWHDWVMIWWESDSTIEQKPELVQECNVHHMETEENKNPNSCTLLLKSCVLCLPRWYYTCY